MRVFLHFIYFFYFIFSTKFDKKKKIEKIFYEITVESIQTREPNNKPIEAKDAITIIIVINKTLFQP